MTTQPGEGGKKAASPKGDRKDKAATEIDPLHDGYLYNGEEPEPAKPPQEPKQRQAKNYYLNSAEFEWSPQRLSAARLLAVGEKTQAEIAKELGIAERTIRNWLANEQFRDEVARQEASYAGVTEDIRKRCERAAQHTITRQQIVGRLVEIANASLGDFVDCHGELDMVKARNSKKDHLLKKIRVIKRTSRDGSSRITKEFEIESPLVALDLLAEITGIKKERQRNPIDSARETFQIMRQDERYKDVSDEELAKFPAERFKVSVGEILEGT